MPEIKEKIVDGLVLVALEVHMWTGRKRLSREALVAANPALADLPPESLATMGAIKIADPANIKGFHQLKRLAEKAIKAVGLPLFGLWAVPQHKLDTLAGELDALTARWERARVALQRDFDVNVEAWKTAPENRGWAHLIKDIPSAEVVGGKMTMGVAYTRIGAPASAGLAQTFHQTVGGLKGDLFTEVAAEAGLLLGYLREGREKVTPKTLGPLRRVHTKLDAFGFMDPSIEPLTGMIAHVLAMVPDRGPIEGATLLAVRAMVAALANPETAMEAGMLAAEHVSPAAAFEATCMVDFVGQHPTEPASSALEAEAPKPGADLPTQAPPVDDRFGWAQDLF